MVLDALEEGIVGTVIAEPGRERLEDRINEAVVWTYSEPVPEGDGHVVAATGARRLR